MKSPILLGRKDSLLTWADKTIAAGAPEEIRTPDPQIRSLVLYPAELRARFSLGILGLRPGCIRGLVGRSRKSALATRSRWDWQGPAGRI